MEQLYGSGMIDEAEKEALLEPVERSERRLLRHGAMGRSTMVYEARARTLAPWNPKPYNSGISCLVTSLTGCTLGKVWSCPFAAGFLLVCLMLACFVASRPCSPEYKPSALFALSLCTSPSSAACEPCCLQAAQA